VSFKSTSAEFCFLTNSMKPFTLSTSKYLPLVPLQPLKDIERSIQKKYRSELWSPFVRALKEFEMVKDGDRIAVAISGGKDSLVLSKLFQELKRASKTNFEVVFISMNPGFNAINLQNLKNNFFKQI